MIVSCRYRKIRCGGQSFAVVVIRDVRLELYVYFYNARFEHRDRYYGAHISVAHGQRRLIERKRYVCVFHDRIDGHVLLDTAIANHKHAHAVRHERFVLEIRVFGRAFHYQVLIMFDDFARLVVTPFANAPVSVLVVSEVCHYVVRFFYRVGRGYDVLAVAVCKQHVAARARPILRNAVLRARCGDLGVMHVFVRVRFIGRLTRSKPRANRHGESHRRGSEHFFIYLHNNLLIPPLRL